MSRSSLTLPLRSTRFLHGSGMPAHVHSGWRKSSSNNTLTQYLINTPSSKRLPHEEDVQRFGKKLETKMDGRTGILTISQPFSNQAFCESMSGSISGRAIGLSHLICILRNLNAGDDFTFSLMSLKRKPLRGSVNNCIDAAEDCIGKAYSRPVSYAPRALLTSV